MQALKGMAALTLGCKAWKGSTKQVFQFHSLRFKKNFSPNRGKSIFSCLWII